MDLLNLTPSESEEILMSIALCLVVRLIATALQRYRLMCSIHWIIGRKILEWLLLLELWVGGGALCLQLNYKVLSGGIAEGLKMATLFIGKLTWPLSLAGFGHWIRLQHPWNHLRFPMSAVSIVASCLYAFSSSITFLISGKISSLTGLHSTPLRLHAISLLHFKLCIN